MKICDMCHHRKDKVLDGDFVNKEILKRTALKDCEICLDCIEKLKEWPNDPFIFNPEKLEVSPCRKGKERIGKKDGWVAYPFERVIRCPYCKKVLMVER